MFPPGATAPIRAAAVDPKLQWKMGQGQNSLRTVRIYSKEL